MRKVLVTTLLVTATVGSQAQVKNQSHGYPIDPVPFTSVKVTPQREPRGNHPPGIQQMRGNRKISELRQRSPSK
mgnify:CR=1 FL=1